MAARIDGEVKGLIGSAFNEAKRILAENRARMDVVVERLKVQETIDAGELDALLGAVSGPAPWGRQAASATQA